MIRSSLRAALRERGFNGVYLIPDIPNRSFQLLGASARALRDRDDYGLDSDPEEFC